MLLSIWVVLLFSAVIGGQPERISQSKRIAQLVSTAVLPDIPLPIVIDVYGLLNLGCSCILTPQEDGHP